MLTQAKATITRSADDPSVLDVQLGSIGFNVSLDEIAATMRNADIVQAFLMQAGLALAEAGLDAAADSEALLATLQNYSFVVSL